jgi:hypothetical protein
LIDQEVSLLDSLKAPLASVKSAEAPETVERKAGYISIVPLELMSWTTLYKRVLVPEPRLNQSPALRVPLIVAVTLLEPEVPVTDSVVAVPLGEVFKGSLK